jgi:hypothetical protein
MAVRRAERTDAGSPARALAASADPTPSSVHVTGSSRNAAYIQVCTTTATNPAATTAR